MKRDFNHLKGKEVKLEPYPLTSVLAKDFFVAQIEDGVGITIMGELIENISAGNKKGDIIKIFCITRQNCKKNDKDLFEETFDYVVKGIEKGVIDIGGNPSYPKLVYGGSPKCAFE
jgi:hypothetical protein